MTRLTTPFGRPAREMISASAQAVPGTRSARLKTSVFPKAMAGATVQYRRELRRLQHDDYVYRDKPQLAAATAVLITLIGVTALALVAFGG